MYSTLGREQLWKISGWTVQAWPTCKVIGNIESKVFGNMGQKVLCKWRILFYCKLFSLWYVNCVLPDPLDSPLIFCPIAGCWVQINFRLLWEHPRSLYRKETLCFLYHPSGDLERVHKSHLSKLSLLDNGRKGNCEQANNTQFHETRDTHRSLERK